ncbi:MAG: hypothetical protein V4850_04660 [Myxococcota bacterium]
MSYTLQALVTDIGAALQLGLTMRALPDGRAIIPLVDELRAKHGLPYHPLLDEDAGLPTVLAAFCAALSQSIDAPIAYVEAEFFGGAGTQASVVWEQGHVTFGPEVSDHAINHALRVLGVRPSGDQDEFDALMLGTYRETEAWLATRS